MQFLEEGVRVGPAPYGLGVYSLRPLARRQRIGPIRGQIIDDPDYQSDYCMELGEHTALEPDAPFRFVNHSCQPNCALVTLPSASAGAGSAAEDELWLETLRAIAAGAQLTIDYGWPAWAATACQCGSAKCRGWIVDRAQRHLVGRETSPDA